MEPTRRSKQNKHGHVASGTQASLPKAPVLGITYTVVFCCRSDRYTAMQDDSMMLIFRTIFGNFLEKFSAECKTLAEPIVAATVGMYNTILADLRPTPAKSHYTYNLRDLSKVFQVTPYICFLVPGSVRPNIRSFLQNVDLSRSQTLAKFQRSPIFLAPPSSKHANTHARRRTRARCFTKDGIRMHQSTHTLGIACSVA